MDVIDGVVVAHRRLAVKAAIGTEKLSLSVEQVDMMPSRAESVTFATELC
jgi:hypothetical protein